MRDLLESKIERTGPWSRYRSTVCFGCHKKEAQPGVGVFGLFSAFGAECKPEVSKGLVSVGW